MFLQGAQQGFAREVSCAVECHVFQEMGKAVLIILLQDGPHVLDDVVTGPACRFRIVTDVVGKPVLKLSDTVSRISRNVFVR